MRMARFLLSLTVGAALLAPLAGCDIRIRLDNDTRQTLGEALSSLVDATADTWDDFTDWFRDRF